MKRKPGAGPQPAPAAWAEALTAIGFVVLLLMLVVAALVLTGRWSLPLPS